MEIRGGNVQIFNEDCCRCEWDEKEIPQKTTWWWTKEPQKFKRKSYEKWQKVKIEEAKKVYLENNYSKGKKRREQ